ncbi:MAG: hypothetical protein C0594_17685 [Marinilabiliales bacterium]|nr:MAG: hypothetical protein C0594_17685 [Marinilabiliales bacterium]
MGKHNIYTVLIVLGILIFNANQYYERDNYQNSSSYIEVEDLSLEDLGSDNLAHKLCCCKHIVAISNSEGSRNELFNNPKFVVAKTFAIKISHFNRLYSDKSPPLI